MITEDYVSFEVAKLLKEKGFDGPCYKVWETHGDSQTLVGAPWFVEGETVVNRELVEVAAKYYAYEYNLNNSVEGYLAPTLQIAMKWLREIHKIVINIGWGEVFEENYQWWCIILNQNSGEILRESEYNKTYEEACEAAIRYCLENLI